jgi:mannan endo-1,4-beta-mannosidase
MVSATKKETQATGMNFVLRNNGGSHHVGSIREASTRRVSRSTPRSSRTNLASLMLAAVALAVTGCSAAEGFEPGTVAGTEPQAMVDAPFEVVAGNEARQEATPSENVGSTPAASGAEPAHTSPSGEGEAKAAPAAVPSSNSTVATGDEASDVSVEVPPVATVSHDTLHTSGRRLLDTCGNPFVTRGVEQVFGNQLPQGNDWTGLLEQIAASGVNAVRILAGTDTLSLADVDALLNVVEEHGMVAYVTPYGNDAMQWLEGQDVRAMLAKHEKYILIDAFGEPTFDDREKFLADSTDAIRAVRSWGYRVPLTVTANQFGRDLPSLFELGEQIIAADPLHNTVLGWQAYWGSNGYYQEHYGMSFEEAVDTIAGAPFPIQLGLDRITDFPSAQTADFSTLMTKTEEHGVGWLWWDWYNPYGNENNLTVSGSATDLTATGDTVLNSHAASVKNTSQRVCIR